MNWNEIELNEVYKLLETSENGLTEEEAKRRLEKFGPNQIEEKKKISDWILFFNQFRSVLITILIIAMVISLFFGEVLDATVIFVIIILNAFLGFFQERKAEKAIEALKKLAAPDAEVIREGTKIISSRELVPGDILLLKVGDKLPADCRILESFNLKLDESILTGESLPVKKSSGVTKNVSVAERFNMLFSGTNIVYGRCKAVAVSTAMNTEFGKIAEMLQTKEEKTPLQKKLNLLGKQLGVMIIAICAVIFVSGILLGVETMKIFMTSVALAVAAIPEGLPAVVTITLAVGLQRMAKRNAIIRRLPSVETLGCATVICSDKTGTLTMNEMTVKRLYVNENIIDVTGEGYGLTGTFLLNKKAVRSDDIGLLLNIGLFCNDADLKSKTGDPTELALLVSARKFGLEDLRGKYKRKGEIPFDSERKMMSVRYRNRIYTKGAVEEVLRCCTKVYKNGKITKLSEKDRKDILKANHGFSSAAFRVLGFAFKELKKKEKFQEKNLVFIGLQGMIDTPRKEVKDAIEKCKLAGIKVVMITGDHKDTAIAIAKQLNLMDGSSLTGKELDALSDEQFHSMVEKISVYARVSPEHKVRITQALEKNGHIVAMTGDGINDAPALKKADIGIAVGSGTDVSKEASDIVLTDDNFSSIVNAIEEGRGIYDNIKKFVYYLLACNFGEVLVIFTAIIFSILTESTLLLPLLPLQILWMNLLTDGLPALALGVEPKEPDVMRRRPRNPKEKLLNRNTLLFVISVGIIMSIGTLYAFYTELPDEGKARTMAFTTLVMFQLFVALGTRSNLPLTKIGLFSNKKLLLAIAISIALQLMVIYLPLLSAVFRTVPLGIMDWAKAVAISLTVFVILESKKFILGRNK